MSCLVTVSRGDMPKLIRVHVSRKHLDTNICISLEEDQTRRDLDDPDFLQSHTPRRVSKQVCVECTLADGAAPSYLPQALWKATEATTDFVPREDKGRSFTLPNSREGKGRPNAP